LKELLETHHIRLINIRNQKSFSTTACYELFYETNFENWQIENIITELVHLWPTVDFEVDVDSYTVDKVNKVIRKHIRTRFKHRILLMVTQSELPVKT